MRLGGAVRNAPEGAATPEVGRFLAQSFVLKVVITYGKSARRSKQKPEGSQHRP